MRGAGVPSHLFWPAHGKNMTPQTPRAKCWRCTMTFRIGEAARERLVCPDCGLHFWSVPYQPNHPKSPYMISVGITEAEAAQRQMMVTQ